MLTIIGCGNLNRSDDAVGIVISQNLQGFLAEHPILNVRVYDCGTAGMEVMFQAKGSQKLIIVDACLTNSSPGTIFEVPGEELENLPAPSYNLHDFRWDHALAAGRKIFKKDFPQEVIVYLIEAENLELGLELTPLIREAATVVVEKLKKQILNWGQLK